MWQFCNPCQSSNIICITKWPGRQEEIRREAWIPQVAVQAMSCHVHCKGTHLQVRKMTGLNAAIDGACTFAMNAGLVYCRPRLTCNHTQRNGGRLDGSSHERH